MKQIIVLQENEIVTLCVIEDNTTKSIRMWRNDTSVCIGTVYVASVIKNLKNIDSSFVKLSDKQKGFLQNSRHNEGTNVLVQIAKDATEDKECIVTENISIPGRYVVIYKEKSNLSFSGKLSVIQKKKLKESLLDFYADYPYGLLLRSEAANVSINDIISEASELSRKLSEMCRLSCNRCAGSIMYSPEKPWIAYTLESVTSDADEVITDQKDLYIELRDFVNNGKDSRCKLSLYSDHLVSLKTLFCINKRLNDSLNEKVYLPSDAYIYIEPTHAFTAVDVNSGKTQKKGAKEDTIFAVNKEAALEICHQLNLRNIGGMILIDFINMKDNIHKEELLCVLRNEFKKDSCKCKVYGYTESGIVEISREKKYKSLYEQKRDCYG